MKRKQALLNLIEYIYQQEKAFIDSLTDAQLNAVGTEENWSAKDLIAHIEVWKSRLAKRLVSGSTPQIDDFNAENATIFETYQNQSWYAVQGLFHKANDDLKDAVSALPDEALEATKGYGWSKGIPVWQRIAGTSCIHPLLHLGEHYHKRGDWARAVELYESSRPWFERLDDSNDWLGLIAYNLACQYALAGHSAQAISQLTQALELRPGLVEWSQEDPDLASLRDDPTYLALY